ncbi:hypothetical protein C2869_06455 [Saccharobesus litoralis]|uniref:Urease accessory protein n=1 Tax=Saccharobesus litoralis TaxID=2172099 RepID=A0A2S0VPI7_9ALTE|nr:hypothetical protein [Saccharobesus litoralis]AWB66103.1 hypothetical protein C2869_06455 [Saccharobesus litoralis]
MMDMQTLSALALGLFVGVFHAFDADHVMAMSSYANQTQKRLMVLKYASKWGLGHGGILLLLALTLVLVGYQLPNWFVHSAELAVGLLLIYLGARLFILFKRKRLVGYQDSSADKQTKKADHVPLFIGMLHGVAGSAPMLALLPSMLDTQFLQHIGLFSVGCLVGMFCFGLGFSQIQAKLNLHAKASQGFTLGLGSLSIGLGGYWLILG